MGLQLSGNHGEMVIRKHVECSLPQEEIGDYKKQGTEKEKNEEEGTKRRISRFLVEEM